MLDMILPEKWGRELLGRPAITTTAPELPGPPPGMVDCACAKKLIPLEEVQYHDTPYMKGVLDTICRECQKNVQHFALVVCLGCRAVVARIPPSIQSNGFRFEADGKYHVKHCPNCVKTPDQLISSPVIEAEIYARVNGLTTKTFSVGSKLKA